MGTRVGGRARRFSRFRFNIVDCGELFCDGLFVFLTCLNQPTRSWSQAVAELEEAAPREMKGMDR